MEVRFLPGPQSPPPLEEWRWAFLFCGKNVTVFFFRAIADHLNVKAGEIQIEKSRSPSKSAARNGTIFSNSWRGTMMIMLSNYKVYLIWYAIKWAFYWRILEQASCGIPFLDVIVSPQW